MSRDLLSIEAKAMEGSVYSFLKLTGSQVGQSRHTIGIQRPLVVPAR